jgi:hypothetical protein
MKLPRPMLHGLLLAAMVSSDSAAGAAPVDDDKTSQKAAGMPDTAEGYLKRAVEYEQKAKEHQSGSASAPRHAGRLHS